MKYTILGASGFIGSHVARLAQAQGHEVFCPCRGERLVDVDLGHVIYCIGLTADFRGRPHDTVAAHVTQLQSLLTQTRFESLVYLSSTRVYGRCGGETCASEEDLITVDPGDPDDLYNLSKLMGESIALSHGDRIRIARLSNVVGPDFRSRNFLMELIRSCLDKGYVELRTDLDSSKDYVWIDDVAEILLKLGPHGMKPIYNLASGYNTTHHDLLLALGRLAHATFSVAAGAPTICFPPIDTARVKEEFNFKSRDVLACLPELVMSYQSYSARAA